MKLFRSNALVSCFVLSLVLLILAGCGPAPDPWKDKGSRPYVVTSFGPLYCFVKNVAKDDAAVVCLATNVGPHHYEYSHDDTLYLDDANLLITNGLGLDDGFIDKMKYNARNRNLKVAKLGNELDKNGLLVELDHDAPGHEGHHHHGHDPHVWLGISDGAGKDGPAIFMVRRIRDLLKEADPANADTYEARAKAYQEELWKVQRYGEEKLKTLKEKKVPIVTSHESLTYFAKSFGLNVIGAIQLRPGVEISGEALNDLIRKCAKAKVGIITIEPQYPEQLAKALHKALAKDEELIKLKIEPKLVTLDPLETCDPKQLNKEWFLKKMRENIDNLAKATP